jgi:hypothetical protein
LRCGAALAKGTFVAQGSASGHASWDSVETFTLNGCYPRRPVPVQRSTSRAGHSAGRMMPKPPGSGPYPPARGHRTRSAFLNTFAKGVLE